LAWTHNRAAITEAKQARSFATSEVSCVFNALTNEVILPAVNCKDRQSNERAEWESGSEEKLVRGDTAVGLTGFVLDFTYAVSADG
jgi:hypothetical protein